MRLYSEKELRDELLRRGCQKIGSDQNGSYWKSPAGPVFQLPPPDEETQSYPDWMLDDFIAAYKL